MAIANAECKLDAPIIFGAAGDKLQRDLIIKAIIWDGCTTAGHDLKVSDYDSQVSYIIAKGAANDHKEWSFGHWEPKGGRRFKNGLKITTMGSGAVYVWL